MLQSRETGGQASSADKRGGSDTRVEADLVRFNVIKLPSGLYRHSPVKFVFEIAHQRRKSRV